MRQLQEAYNACPTHSAKIAAEGKNYTVTRHFTGKEEIDKIVAEIAYEQADRTSGMRA